MAEKKRILSGIRPTGKLHLGHWAGVISNWVQLQKEYRCFFMVADWHALMSEYKSPKHIKGSIIDNVADWLAWGVDEKSSVVFVQSDVKEHLELYSFLSMLVPLGWLYRCPTFKEQMQQLKEKDINTYAFLGYPVLQAADIILYNSHAVPVGEDQLPHLELTREVVRRFHSLYDCEIFNEPESILTKVPKLLGFDGRKMSKSYNNFIGLDEEDKELQKKVMSMVTDPSRIKKTDPGHPEICTVFAYYKLFGKERIKEVESWCKNAEKGCVECKKIFAQILIDLISEKREMKKNLLKDKGYIEKVLENGAKEAADFASQTLKKVKKAVLG